MKLAEDVSRYTTRAVGDGFLQLACGALVCARGDAARVSKALPKSFRTGHITRYAAVQAPAAGDKREEPPVRGAETRTGAEADDPTQRAVHLSPVGAACLSNCLVGQLQGGDDNNEWEEDDTRSRREVPPALLSLLRDGTCAWHDGLRVGSPECRGVAGEERDFHLSQAERRQNRDNALEALQADDYLARTQRGDPAAERRRQGNSCLFRFCELFAGIGGFRVGLEPLGGECVFASELELGARKVYQTNFGGSAPAGDIIEVPDASIPSFDLLTAGFPCQSWSIQGKIGGFADPRGALFFEITRVLRAKRPAGFLLENVPHLADVADGAALRFIVAELESVGYSVVWRVLSSRPVIPQRRLRLYIVGFRSSAAAAAFSWPEWASDGDLDATEHETTPGGPRPTEALRGWPTVDSVLEPMLELQSAEGSAAWDFHALSPKQWRAVCTNEARNQAKEKSLWGRMVNVSGAARTLIGGYRQGYIRQSQFVLPPNGEGDSLVKLAIAEGMEQASAHGRVVGAASHADGREEPEPRGNDAGGSERPIRLPRFFTPRECFRMQGFPDSYQIPPMDEPHRPDARPGGRIFHMIGNAVAPTVIRCIGEEMLRAGLLEGRA
jgi:DNA-cytosine methyltransferase